MQRNWMLKPILCLLVAISTGSCLASPLALDPLFSQGMVLQREIELPVWGSGAVGKTIHVRLADHDATALVSAEAAWSVRMPALPAGGPYELTVTSDGETVRLKDVWVGDVWLASGQSNMAMILEKAEGGTEAATGPSHLPLRICKVERIATSRPRDEISTIWTPGSGEFARQFSAVGFFFGWALTEKTGIPIGVIDASWGGTPIQAWTRNEVLTADADFRPILNRWSKTLENYPDAKARWDSISDAKRQRDFEQRASEARTKGLPQVYPDAPPDGPDSPRAPSVLWNGMIHPLSRLPIKGVIWYQGESNAPYAEQYLRLFPAMITDWRKQWGIGSFPFYFVQLPNFNAFRKQVEEPRESAWAEMREAQAHVRTIVPNTNMAVTIDVGESDEIHPRDKRSVGNRLALLALRHVYGQKVICDGPRYLRHKPGADGIEVEFSQVAAGLRTKDHGASVRAIAVAGSDRKFIWANARIIGPSTIFVARPPGCAEIESIRYNWGDTPGGNLCNSAGLPAEPFRTDTWPGQTTGKR